MLVLIYHRYLQSLIWLFIIILFSCNDAEYQLDNEFDPENLGLEPPTIFFHPSEFDPIEIGRKDTLELYSYEVTNAAGAHLQVEFDAEVITINAVEYGDFFMNGVTPPIMFTHQEDGFLNIYLFLQPTIGISNSSGTMSMAKILFTVKDEGLALIRYTNNTVLRNENNISVLLNSYGEGLINAIQ